MHAPNPISMAAKMSGEPEFREIGVGPWAETHPGEPRPDDPASPSYDMRYDTALLDDGDRRNVLDRYRYWTVAAIKADLDARGRHDFEVAVENWTHDFNIGSMVRTANAFQARRVHIVGPHKWNRKGALMTELYQHVENHPSITELVECWRHRIAGEIAAARAEASSVAIRMHRDAAYHDAAYRDAVHRYAYRDAYRDTCDLIDDGASAGTDPASATASIRTSCEVSTAHCVAGDSPTGTEDRCRADHTNVEVGYGQWSSPRNPAGPSDATDDGYARIAAIDARIRELESARIIALDIIPGAVPIETYTFPKRCLLLFGAEGPGLSRKALDLADDVVYISQFGSVRSINAGAAAAVAMHAYIAQHAVVR